jgi:general secretion pathway protein D
MTVLVQVQALAGDREAGGVTLPVFTNRSIQHEIRLAEGETNILGGIIQDTEGVSIGGLPGLKDIPLLRYLFSRETRSRDETEIIIMLTPHIVRMPNISAMNLRGVNIGTEVNTRLRTPLVTPGAAAAEPAAIPQGTVTPVPTAPAAPETQPAPAAAATLSFAPIPVTLGTAPSVMNIGIDGSNIFGVDLTLSFDPLSLTIREINDGGFLGRDGQFVSVVQKIDTEAGTATVSLERAPGAPPVFGNGVLLTLVLQGGARKGDSLLRVTDFRVRDARQVSQPGRPAEVHVTVP